MREIGKNIRQLRTRQQMTQDDLAEKLFVTRQTVSNYETGKSRPDVDMMLKIAEVLGTDIQTIIYGPEQQKNPQIRRLLIAGLLTAILGIVAAVLQPAAEELARNTYRLVPGYLAFMFLKPVFCLMAGWTAAQVLGMALKKKPFHGKIAKRIGLLIAAFLIFWFGLSILHLTLAPEWLCRGAYRIYVFFYKISVPYYAAFLIPGAALWLCSFPPERKSE